MSSDAGDRESRQTVTGVISEGAFPITPPARRPRDESALDIVRRAEALKIPWERLLTDEIRSEEMLRRHVPDGDSEVPLAAALSLLPSSFLTSWRVRDHIQALSCEARGASFRKAVGQLRMVFRRLIGQPGRGEAAFAGQLWLAYQRILMLQRVCRAAGRSSGSSAERLSRICARTRCSIDDAAWAISREDSPRPGHRLDAAIRKARDEGLPVPRAPTEARSFARLRRILRASARPPARRAASARSRDPISLPPRASLSAHRRDRIETISS